MKAKHLRFAVLLTVVMLLVSMLGIAAYAAGTNIADEPVCYKHGDINADNTITSDDAVYLLFASFGDMFGDDYPLEQSGDIDGNSQFNGDDAVYLLFASYDMFQDQYPLKGTVHNYYDPIWTWDTTAAVPTAQVSLKCACGQPHTVTEGITVTPGTVTNPTCVTTGSKVYTASVTYQGATFTNTVTVTLDALGTNGHEFNGTPTCTNSVKCENCDYELPKLDHSYQLLDAEKVDGCKHTKRYQCSACQDEIDGTAEGDVYYTHSYTATIEQEATCSVKGKKLLTCACGDSYYEDIEKNNSHTWTKGSTENGVTTYNCACGQTKTVVEVAKDEAVSADALKNNEVQLEGGTTVALDDATVEQLDTEKTIKITVEAVKAEQVQMDSDKKEQIGENDIYDFSMTYSDGTPISDFDGYVTVALPYTLQPGDDVNSIDVWYIADNGDVECVKGVYSNSYVTFQTNHFSYYTVTRLTPAQRCAVYGHVEVTTTKAATCTEDGYTKVYCQRCNQELSQVKSAMLGHSYKDSEEKSKAATCDAAGLNVKVCQRCNHEKSEEVKQLVHQWEKTETIAPDCTNKGYDKYTCQLCQKEKTENEKEPTGHSWGLAENAWQWNEDNTKATVTLACRHDTHKTPFTKVLTANVTKSGDVSVCLGGELTFTATVYFNNEPYTDTKVDVQTGPGHTPGSKWESDGDQHYHLCGACGEKVGAADHQWQRTVHTPASCKDGSATDKCAICDKTKPVVLPAIGDHTYVNGVCTGCGQSASCDHKILTEKVYDLSQYGACEGSITIRSCSCGKVYATAVSNVTCDFVEEKPSYNEELDRYEYRSTCKVCGLVQENIEADEYDKNACTGAYVIYTSLYKGDTVIVSATHREGILSNHPAVVEVKTYNLADYGMCAGVVRTFTCFCGERHNFEMDSDCNFVYDEATGKEACSVCGTVINTKYNYKKQGCFHIENYEISYSQNNVAILTLLEQYYHAEHNTKIQDYKLYGESCEDGVCIDTVCEDCGLTDTRYYQWCITGIVKQEIDTTGTGFCTDSIEVVTCPCGREAEYYLMGEGNHNWQEVAGDEGARISVCDLCGYTRFEEETVGEKNEKCEAIVSVNTVFADDKNHRFVVSIEYVDVDHDMETTYKLETGNCEDGVTITETCKECGYSYSWETSGHYIYTAGTLDLTGYGCGECVFIQQSCPCGRTNYLSDHSNCYFWQYDHEITEKGYIEKYRCETCGLIKEIHTEYAASTDPCRTNYIVSTKFYKDEQFLGQLGGARWSENHRYVYTLTLNPGATDCDGGWSGIGTCVECGATTQTSGDWCSNHIVSRESVSSADMCGQLEKVTYRCACGKRSYVDVEWVSNTSCNFAKEVYDEELGRTAWVCETCGSSYYDYQEEVPVEGATCEYLRVHYYVYKNPDGDILITLRDEWPDYNHDFVYSYVLNGTTCAEGYQIYRTCMNCGFSEDYGTSTYCERYLVGRELVHKNDCGVIYANHYSCACGANESYTCNGEGHRFEGSVCETCGLHWENSQRRTQIPNTCRATVNTKDVFTLNGETVATVENTWEVTNHIYVYTFQLNGDSCEDGYTRSRACVFCGDAYADDSVYYDHSYETIAYYQMPEGSCGGDFYLYGCACGENVSANFNQNCDFDLFDEEISDDGYIHWYRCEECGLVEKCQTEYLPSSDPCKELRRYTYTYYRDDQMLLNFSYIHTQSDHNYIYSYNMYGQTCDEGYDVYGTCLDCGYATICVNGNYGCSLYRTSAEKVYENEAICGSVYEDYYRCPCGAMESYGFSSDNHSWDDGVCKTCGLEWVEDSGYTKIPGTCRVTAHNKATFRLNGEVVYTAEKTWSAIEHVYITTYYLNGDSCEDGWTYSNSCFYCGYTNSSSEVHYGHNTWTTAYCDLPDNSCGGYIELRSCACGKESYLNSDLECDFSYRNYHETDENGIEHSYTDYTCRTCGMSYNYEYYCTVGETACEEIAYRNYTFKLGDWEKYFAARQTNEDHDYQFVSAALDKDVTNCEDGIHGLQRCVDCGYEVEFTSEGHIIANVVESFDLSNYGSVCGGSLILKNCPCGKAQGYAFSDDTHCDLSETSTEYWIKDMITDSQHTTEGYIYHDNLAYNRFCSVTEPICGLKLRTSRYWLKEGCAAVQYETWEYFDAATETWSTISTAKTGETHAYHAYKYTDFEETVDGKRTSGGRYVCPDCGSTYDYTYYHDADGNETKYVSEAVNTLDNGEPKRYTCINEYVIISGLKYTSLERYETVYADDTEYWYQNAFTYDFTEGCYRTQVYSDSDGDTYTYEKESAHHSSRTEEILKESTCSQSGAWVERYICDRCNMTTSEYINSTNPTDHNWSEDEETGMYYCLKCGLESKKDASGSIVMEDLTDEYTEGNYVIGYWNHGEVKFSPYVSLVLYDVAEDENDELVLTDIDFTYLTVKKDGICGLAFNQEAVAAAASAAIEEAGYTGTYAVRISFVPENGTDTLDYAITFETLTAA